MHGPPFENLSAAAAGVPVWLGVVLPIVVALASVVAGLGAFLLKLRIFPLEARAYRRADEGSYQERRKNVVEYLGADKVYTQLTGLDEISRLIDTRKEDRQALINQFCDFLRNSCSTEPDDSSRQIWTRAVKILNNRLQPTARVSWRGGEFNLSGVVMVDTDLSGVDLTDTTLCFEGAHIEGVVSFDRVVFGEVSIR